MKSQRTSQLVKIASLFGLTATQAISTTNAVDTYKILVMESNYSIWTDDSNMQNVAADPTEGDDILWSNNNFLYGLAGDDVIHGGDGNNSFYGGAGNDMIFANAGNDSLGNCQSNLVAGNDIMYAGPGDDTFCDNAGHNWFIGGAGNDTVFLPAGGGDGDDSYFYSAGVDSINLGAGFDTLFINNIPYDQAAQWQYEVDGINDGSLVDFTYESPFQELRVATNRSGYVQGPNGERVEFNGIDNIQLTFSYPIQFSNLSSAATRVATIITGLPEGFTIKGLANTPVLGDDGYWFQAVDQGALAAGELELIPSKGYYGPVNLSVVQVFEEYESTIIDGNEVEQLQIIERTRGALEFDILPSNDALLFAQLGTPVVDDDTFTALPLDIIVNGQLLAAAPNLSVKIYIPRALQLTNSAQDIQDYQRRTTNIPDEFVQYLLKPSQLAGLRIANPSGNITVKVSIGQFANGKYHAAMQRMDLPELQIINLPQSKQALAIPDNISDYDISRIGNSIIARHVTRPSTVIRISLLSVDFLRFNNGFVDVRDFTKRLDISNAAAQVTDPDRQMIVIAGLPGTMAVNNAIPLGNGAFGVPASDVIDNAVDLELPALGAGTNISISASVHTLSEEQVDFFLGQARVSGYANAQAFMDAGADAAFIVGPDGVRAEARAYVSAGAVATAGGSIGGLSGNVEAAVERDAEAYVSVITTDEQQSISAYVGAEIAVSATALVTVENAYVPGTQSSLEGTVGLSAVAYVGGDQNIYFGDGQFGVDAEGGAEVGFLASADGYAYATVAGVGGGIGGGVSAGIGIGLSGGGHAGFDNGTIHFGASGEVAALIGVEFDFDIEIDTNAVADTGQLIGQGVISGADALENGFITVATAVNDLNILSGVDAVNRGFISAEMAVLEGLISAQTAVSQLGANANYLLSYGYNTQQQAINQATRNVVNLVQETNVNQIVNKTVRRATRPFRRLF